MAPKRTYEELMLQLTALSRRDLRHLSADKITSPSILYTHLKHFAEDDQERFVVVTLTSTHRIINIHEVFRGTANKTLVVPRDVFRAAVSDNAISVIIAHNHPSGYPAPSQEDLDVTTRMVHAGQLLGISVLDHMIVAKDGYTSILNDYPRAFDASPVHPEILSGH